MPDIRIEITIPSEVLRIGQIVEDGLQRGIAAWALSIERRAKLNLTGRFAKVRTGRLRSSVTTQVGPGLQAKIGTKVIYGEWLEVGTRPHIIRPKTRRFLRFKTADGQTVFTRLVRHPGTKPRPWLRTAAEESLPEGERLIDQAVQRALRERNLG